LAIEVGEFARRCGTVYVPWEMWNSLRLASQESMVGALREAGLE
jgi:hypothetical protein